MEYVFPRLRLCTRFVIWILISVSSVGVAEAQGQADCRSRQPPSVGVAFGRSSPYLDLAQGIIEGAAPGSVLVNGGAEFVARGDLPVTGPLRLRIEGATARWDVRQTMYGPDGAVMAETSAGRMSARHFVALVGLRTGRAPLCAHVSGGGGLYALGFRDESVRRPGAALAAGLELPTGQHGAIQVDAVLHLISTSGAYTIASSTVPVLNLLAGWAYRF